MWNNSIRSFQFGQILFLLLQVFFVGLTLGMTRTVIPVVAELEFLVAKNSSLFVMSFLIAFGLSKAILNLQAGQWSDLYGRKNILVFGWLIALPIPLLLYFANHWYWLVFAMGLLGIHQGMTWSMTQTAKLDQTALHQKGLIIGLNEFSGYIGMSLAGIWTADLSLIYGSRETLLYFGMFVMIVGALTAKIFVKESKANLQITARNDQQNSNFLKSIFSNSSLFSIIQAGLVEKFVDALVWIILPIYLLKQGLDISAISRIVGLYGVLWGIIQLGTGYLSDMIGRKWPILIGMSTCTIGVFLILYDQGENWWRFCTSIIGIGMALLYPTLSASVSDLANAENRGIMIGTYRFFRDLGLAVAGIFFGILMMMTQMIEIAFWVTVTIMTGSTIHIWYFLREGQSDKL